MNHLTMERKLTVAKVSPGAPHINKEIFNAQIIVTTKLPPEENLYLRCLTDKLIERTKKEADEYYLPKIEQLSSQNTYFKSLLTKNGIPFDPNGIHD